MIGAGAAGLCAARHLVGNSKFEMTIYEQTSEIGGIWVYDERVGTDENGLPIHTSMYHNLRFVAVSFHRNNFANDTATRNILQFSPRLFKV